MNVTSAIPVLQVSDVARSISWYQSVFGFSADHYPDTPPYSFAVLRGDQIELMLQDAGKSAALSAGRSTSSRRGWAVYFRLEGGELSSFAEEVRAYAPLLRGPERMAYGLVEFEVADPDGHRLCISEFLQENTSVRFVENWTVPAADPGMT